MILLIDNYDSFTWNLYQSLAAVSPKVEVLRNDALSLEGFLAIKPAAVVISPGPGRPQDAGLTPALLAALPEQIPLLGICLGHQALCEHYGAQLEIDPTPMHGKSSEVHHEQSRLLKGLKNPMTAGRYHSIRVPRSSMPDCLRICAWTQDDVVMAVEHKELPRFGLQFHPESILSPQGDSIVENFVKLIPERGTGA